MRFVFSTIILLLVHSVSIARLNVVIDPGHGGVDAGTSNSVVKESNLVLEIAQIIEKKIQQDFDLASQFNIKLTREKDQHMNLVDRIVPQFDQVTDLFLSLHINSSTSKRAQGMEVYFDIQKPSTKIVATKSDEQEQIVNDIIVDLSETGRNKWSQVFAETLREQWTLGTAKIKRVPFFVLTNNSSPSVLIEAGYLTNSKEYSLLIKKEHQEAIADSVIKSLLTYKQIAYK